MVKDRLSELKKLSNEKTKNTTLEIENTTQNDTQTETKNLRMTFQRADVVGQWIEQIEKNNQEIRVQLRRVEDINRKDVDAKLKSSFENNTFLAHQTSSKLKEMDKELKEIKAESTEKRIKSIQFTTLQKRFEKAFLENNHLLESYGNCQRQLIKSQLIAKGYFHVTDEEVALLLEEGTDIQVFTENILAETAEAKLLLADVEERHQQLLQIERMLTEVRDMFVQMSILVDSQQELVDRIEYQAQTAVDTIGDAQVNLKKGEKLSNKRRKVSIYCTIAIIVVVLIILIMLLK